MSGEAAAPAAWQFLGQTVRGAHHRRAGRPTQDALAWERLSPSAVLLALADGHGSPNCFRSDRGARFAVNAALATLRRLLAAPTARDAAGFPRELVRRWRRAVRADLATDPISPAELRLLDRGAGAGARRQLAVNPYLAYGSTVLGAAATPDFLFLFQLGDGDILLVDAAGGVLCPWLRGPNRLGVETDSLCAPGSARLMRVGSRYAAGHRLHAASGVVASGPREEMPAKFRPAARECEKAIGRGGGGLSTEMSAATERSASGGIASAVLPALAAAPPRSAIPPAEPWPELVILSTDGYADSFKDEAGFLQIGGDLLRAIQAEGAVAVGEQLEGWLDEASLQGSGDDITLAVLHRGPSTEEEDDSSNGFRVI